LILFKTIKWKNFLSTGNVYTEINLNKNDTTLIVGENGAGKSTLLDALSFVLYNKPFRKINKPQLLNAINRKNLTVEVEFDIGTAHYKVVRGLKPTVFEVYMNDRLLNQDADVRDYQDVLEKQILKLNHKSFCQVVVLGSASFVPFMQLPAASRREVIEDLLDIQIFSTMNVLLKEKITANNTKVVDNEHQYELTAEKIKMQHEHILAMQKNNNEQIEKYKADLKAATERIDTEKAEIEALDDAIISLKEAVSDKDTITKRHNKVQVLESQLADKIRRIKDEISFLENHDNCPTCKQEIDEQFKCNTVEAKQIDEASTGMEQLRQEIENLHTKIEQAAKIQAELSDLNIRKYTASNNINGLIQQCKKLANDITEIQQKNDDFIMNDDKMIELEQLIDQLVELKSELLKEKEALNIASIILKDNGIKARIIKQYIPVINKLINKYLAAMDFFVQFELNENFDETIKSRFRDEFSYASFSEGEKMRINLAILFTWRAIAKLRNSASTNLLIMDEVLDGSLDSNGTDEFLKILSNLTQDTNTFIISHKVDQLYDKFAHIIRFEKHKNFSRIAA
jgi:DNA repair exonuclease SbcCD ATPase subunit